MKKILILMVMTMMMAGGINAEFIKKSSSTPTGEWDFRQGTIFVDTPTASGQAANKDYVDMQVLGGTVTYAVDAGTAVYADNSGLLNGRGTDYFATATDLSNTAASTGTNKALIDINISDINDLGYSTGTNKTLIDANTSGVADLGASTGTIYTALQSTGAALSDEIARAIARENDIAVSTGTNASDIYDLQISTGENKDRIASLEYSTAVLSGQIDSLQGQITTNDDAIEAIGVSTGTIYDALKSTGVALSVEIADTDTNFNTVATDTTTIYTALKSTGASLSDHIANNGSDHSFIDQDVTSGSSPILNGENFTGVAASSVTADNVYFNKLGTPAYETGQDWINITQSAGVVRGGKLTDNGDGTVSISSGSGFIKTTNNELGETLMFDWPANANIYLTDNEKNTVYIDYNNGSPYSSATITPSTDINHNSIISIGPVHRYGTTLHPVDAGTRVQNFARRAHKRARELRKFDRASGMIISDDGGREFSSTAGVYYVGYNRVTTSSQASGIDTFTYYMRDGSGGWKLLTSSTVIDNTHYDDGSGVLGDLTPTAPYGVHYVHIDLDGHQFVQFGQNKYKLADAVDAQPPAGPTFLSDFALLRAKIIIKKDATELYAVLNYVNKTITPFSAIDHNDLGNLNEGDYLHLTAAEYANVDGLTSDAQDQLDSLGVSTGTNKTLIDANATAISTTGVQVATNIDDISTNETAISTTGVALLALETEVDGKQAELSTDTWKAYDSGLWDGVAISTLPETYLNINDYSTGMSTGVSQIKAGDNITISPTDGRGVVTINSTGGGEAGSALISKNFSIPTTPFVTDNIDKTSFGNYAVTLGSITVYCDSCPLGSKTQFDIRVTTASTDFTTWGTPWSILASTYTLYIEADDYGTIITGASIANPTIPAGARLILDIGSVGSTSGGAGFVINMSGESD